MDPASHMIVVTPIAPHSISLARSIALEEGAEVQVYLKFDGGEWLKVDEKLCEAKKRSYYLPIVPRRGDHYRLKLEGKGTFRLYSLTREYYSGSELKSTQGRN